MPTVNERIQIFNQHLPENLKAIKFRAMLENPFRFFRGTCHLFYEDLSQVKNFPESPTSWLCGDLHLENFGSFKANNRMVYFDLNDFDESILGPALWEISRVLSSIFVALELLDFKEKSIREIANIFLTTYSETLKSAKPRYIDPRTATGLVRRFLKSASLLNEKFLLNKTTYIKNGKYAIRINDITHFKLEKSLREELIETIKKWAKDSTVLSGKFKVLDAAFRVAGTGSIGLNRYMFLLQNREFKREFLFIEMKTCTQSSLSPYIKINQPDWKSQGDRVILTKYRMQNVSPALLSTIRFREHDFVIQEMQPTSNKFNFEIMPGNREDIIHILKDMAILAASAQLRSSGIQGSAINDEFSQFGQKTDWHNELVDYASSYSKQTINDYQEFRHKFKKSATTV